MICISDEYAGENLTPRLLTVYHADVSLPSSLTKQWLMTILCCCLVPTIIMYV